MTGQGHIAGPFRLSLPARRENVAVVRAAIAEFAESHGVETAVISDLRTVVSEASANVVLHAYAGSAEPGPLEVEMTQDATTVRVVVRDRGLGIRPQSKTGRSSLKMGLPLIGAISSGIHLRSSRDRGTELSMDLPRGCPIDVPALGSDPTRRSEAPARYRVR